MQPEPGHFFTVVQIFLNAIAILGGILGEQSLTPYFAKLLHSLFGEASQIDTLSFINRT
nr:hypothetical protein [uncultured Undibacterium sp.]